MNKSEQIVNSYKTRYDEGFLNDEIKILIEDNNFDAEEFSEHLGTHTVLIKEDGKILTFKTDIEKAVRLCLGGTVHYLEWD